MRLSPLAALLWTLALLVMGTGAGALAGQEAATRVRDPYAPVDTLVRVLAIVEQSWVDEVTTQELVDAALDGMVTSLDRHSAWLPASRWTALREDTHGHYPGLGLEVRLVQDVATVIRVVPDSPAHAAGVQADDRILAVDGEPVTDALLDPTLRHLVTAPDAPAVLRVMREGWSSPRDLTARRELVRTPSVTVERLDSTTAWIRVDQFREGAAAELDAALRDLEDGGGLAGVVLDLRDNPGGLLREAVAVADAFLESGTITRTVGREASREGTWEATAGSWSGPLVVLVNGLSASGSEIVAAALQDRGRAQLVGTRTYGKGSVQTVYEHRDGSALKLTVGRYLTPSGAPVADRNGRAPDVEVPWPGDVDARALLRDAIAALEVPDADREHLRALVDELPDVTERRTRTDIPWAMPVRQRLAHDPQLSAAYDLVRAQP